ncbi:TPA: DUF1372 family protein [Streptococcus pyogenes]|nr:DUF1372 family protein [Streptococcus pyogenes]
MDELTKLIENLSKLAICFISLMTGILIGGVAQPIKSVAKQPIIIHTVDNAGSMMAGKITDKEIIEGRYTVTAGAYGKFIVTKEQYESLKVGDEIPSYLKERGARK